IMGLRLFTNPDFNVVAEKHWDAEKYYNDPDYYNDKDLVRPYRVGMSCGFCHTGPNPVNPPSNPEEPEWANLNSNPGAQYYWVDRIFFWNTRSREDPAKPAEHEHNVIFQLLHTNPPGTLDTSLISTDYINNPRTMNAVYSLLARLEPTLRWGKEKLTGGELDNKQFQDYPQTEAFSRFWNKVSGETKTARVLKDGSDSVGILGALNRVYLNIGLFSEEWLLHFRPVIGGRKISPIKIKDAVKNSAYWRSTEDQTADMAIFFLVTATPDRLADLEEERREKHLQASPEKVYRGKVVFAENCAVCHSSDIPLAPEGSGIDEGICADGGNGANYRQCWDRYWRWAQTDEFKAEMRKKVLAEGFLVDNFLSTERRVPVDLLQTNACGPLATNALDGDIWDNFSSTTYKELPPVKELTVHHPVSGGVSSFQPLGSGRGYTRPASLVSLWSTAPFLLNNSLGHVDYPYTKDGYYGVPTGNTYDAGSGGSKTYGAGGAGSETSYGAAGGKGYKAGYGHSCPAGTDTDPYLPCVDNRMRVFNDSIRKLLNPELRRKDTHTTLPVPGYMYRTTALTCVKVPKGFMPGIVQTFPGFFNWLADWAIDEEGNLELGPLPKGFPINALVNTKLLPDNDEPGGFDHYWKLIKAGPTLLGTFKKLGGRCSPKELDDPGSQVRAEKVIRETGFIDTLVGLSKCPDYVVNRGHYFGSDLPNADKEALIEFLKTF
ncbi:MAG: cytochrome c, partial [Candidatus Krumholzibacteria bacterium]